MLVCHDVQGEIAFCRDSFDAVELGNRAGQDGKIVHALLSIKGAMVIIEGEWPGLASHPPRSDGSSPVVIFIYVTNVDDVVTRAVKCGARILLPIANQFWGDRTCRIIDPAGHVWIIATRIEETSAAQRDDRWSRIVEEAGN